MLKFNTFLKYDGRPVKTMYQTQFLQMWATMKAHTCIEENIARHGYTKFYKK